jgi:hypothetical protein
VSSREQHATFCKGFGRHTNVFWVCCFLSVCKAGSPPPLQLFPVRTLIMHVLFWACTMYRYNLR